MDNLRNSLSKAIVEVPVPAVRRMIGLVKLLDRISRSPLYRKLVYSHVPDVARFDPGHDSVMMCYDFHLLGDVPKLIEVNTNAGGSLLAYLVHDPSLSISPRIKKRLLQTFAEEMSRFSGGEKAKPERIAIIDEKPESQYLYPEMCAFADQFREWGVPTEIISPEQLDASAEGVFLDGAPIDFVYNRHCDFYFESDEMAGLKDAYLAKQVCLSPNPHMYGLLADKRRAVLWATPECREALGLSAKDLALLNETILSCALLGDLESDQAWANRKKTIFKPVDSFGSRGVLHGAKISRKRFQELPLQSTLVQELAPPSMTPVPDSEPMKTDLRVYAYRSQVLGITARLYRGQVTNMRTPGGGFARVKIT